MIKLKKVLPDFPASVKEYTLSKKFQLFDILLFHQPTFKIEDFIQILICTGANY
jgi:hypothetical protein